MIPGLRILAAAAMVTLLAACSITGETGAVVDETYGYNPGQFAGVNQVWIDADGNGTPDLVGTGGKEQGSISIEGSIPAPDGQLIPFTYTATDVKAFDGQRFRAELEAIIAQANAEGIVAMTPELADVMEGIVDAALKVATGGAG